MKILVTAHALVGGAAMLTACGQKGPLFVPSTPESAGRATLPQTLKIWPTSPASNAPAVSPSATSKTTDPLAAPAGAPATAPLTTAPEAPAAAPK